MPEKGIHMYNFFSYDAEAKPGTHAPKGAPFLTECIPEEQNAELTAVFAETDRIAQQAQVSCLFALILRLALFSALALTVVAIEVRNDPKSITGLLIALGISVLTAGAMIAYQRRRNRRYAAQMESCEQQLRALLRKAAAYFRVPADAVELDCISTPEQDANDPPAPGNQSAIGRAIPLYAFTEGNNICLVSARAKYRIPKEQIGQITPIWRYRTLVNWNKEATYHSPAYQQFEIKKMDNGTLSVISGKIEIASPDGGLFLVIPNYDLEAFHRLAGL